MVYVIVSPGLRFTAETLFKTESPGWPIDTFATFELDPAISFATPTAVFGITVPTEPEFTSARKETEPLDGDVM
jgi:hypothetical protein